MPTTTGKITSINVRMYRYGTGDFFLLQLKKGDDVNFNLMIDCGCIGGVAGGFDPYVNDLADVTGNKIDLLVVTHEHMDHINGFEKAKHIFDTIEFQRVWFAWTEDKDDPVANDYRQNKSKVGAALKNAVTQLSGLVEEGHYEKLFEKDKDGQLMAAAKNHFIGALSDLNLLNLDKPAPGQPYPTMVELLTEYNVIKPTTVVEFWNPGDTIIELENAEGIRIHVLGPPKETQYLNRSESKKGNYDKRESPSNVDFALMAALNADDMADPNDNNPFDDAYEMKDTAAEIIAYYESQQWRNIKYDWLYGAGDMAMKYETSINNTSLALALQFEDSEKVLLFPGDAELGNWQSWHEGHEWPVLIDNKIVYKNAEYLLNKTVFYKVGHHLSHNGTATLLGIDMIKDPNLVSMATLDIAKKKINSNWLSTMPNDLLSAELIKKTAGRLLFLGDAQKIMDNVKTSRVSISPTHEKTLTKMNNKFNGNLFIEHEIEA